MYRATLPREWKHIYDFGPNVHFEHKGDGMVRLFYSGASVVTLSLPSAILRSYNQRSDVAWIVASGPSIKDIPLSKIDSGDVFTVNGSIGAVVESGLKPQGSFIVDRDFFRSKSELVELSLFKSAHCYFSGIGLSILLKKGFGDMLANSSVTLFDVVGHQALVPCRRKNESWSEWARRYPNLDVSCDYPLVGWSYDPDYGVFGGATIVFAALQLLLSQGYQKIFMLGLDMHYGGRVARFYESGLNMRPSHLTRDMEAQIIPSFKCAIKAAKENGVELYNVTEGSGLRDELIPWISFEQALSLAHKI